MYDSMMANEKQTRAFFRQLNKFMLFMWRLGLGPFLQSPYWSYIMVLDTTGHKSGLRRLAPMTYDRDDRVVYCLPGFGVRTHWYRNLKADPHCEVWLPDGRWTGVAEEVTDPEEHLRILRRLLIRSGYVTRLVEGTDAALFTDDQMHELAGRYDKTMRIRLVERRAGPGDWAWVWPVLLMTGLALWGLRCLIPRRSRSGGG